MKGSCDACGVGGYCCTSNLNLGLNGPGNGNCPADFIAAIPKTVSGYACVLPKSELVWHGPGLEEDPVAVLNKGFLHECCKWHDIRNMFDIADGNEA